MMVFVGASKAHIVRAGGCKELVLMKMIAHFQFKVFREEDFTWIQKQRISVHYAKENFICIFHN